MKTNSIYRYKREITLKPEEDGRPNWYYETNLPDYPKVILARGINTPAFNINQNIPVIILRTSQWRSGTSDVPWEDRRQRNTDSLIYWGDGKFRPRGKDVSIGNQYMMKAFGLHSGSKTERKNAPPIVYVQAVPVNGSQKGYVQFVGMGVITKAESKIQRDPVMKDIFLNICFEVHFIDLSQDNQAIDWKWINARRTEGVDDNRSLLYAPKGWIDWIEKGLVALPGINRIEHVSQQQDL